jgi:cobalt-zinc-cadmium efflux system membrane fusion protein
VKTLALVAALFSLLLTGCGNKDAGGSKAGGDKESAQTPPAASDTVKINADAQKMVDMRVMPVRSRTVPETLLVAGQIVMNEERTAHIGSYTTGRIVAVYANVGDSVKQGAVLARMHSHEVHETIAAYQSALQDVQRQQSALDFGMRTRDRMRRLYALKFASQQEVERAETDVHNLQASLAEAHISVQREIAHLSDILHLAPAALNHIDESMERVPVVSPISGVITARLVTPGSVVEPGQEVYTVSDPSTVWMMASVNEQDIAKVRVGDRATVTSKAFPDTQFSATVTRMSPELDTATRTLPVRLLVPNPGFKLRAAMYANARIDQGKTRSAIFIPEEAIQEVNGGSIVFVRKSEGEFEARPIQIARRIDGDAEISAGLKPGEAVIVKGSFVAKSEMLKSQIGE